MPDPTDPRAVADGPSGIVQQMPEGRLRAECRYSTDSAMRHFAYVVMVPDPDGDYVEYEKARATEADLRAEVERLNALADLRAQHAAWSQAQFGDVSAVGPAKHLAKEAMEVAADPLDPIEHADCWMLLWDMQRRAGISDAQLADAIQKKLAINQARRWPAPKEGEAREHDRAALTPETDGGHDGT